MFRRSLPESPKRVRFVEIPRAAMSALLGGDLGTASTIAGVQLPQYFMTERALWLWRYRLSQDVPAQSHWTARYAVLDEENYVVGHAGFHGPPDEAGMVEVAYSVAPEFRRQGYARSMLIELLRRAAEDPAVTTVRASISPDNAASLATISGLGFAEKGEQWDEQDGRELIFEVPVNSLDEP